MIVVDGVGPIEAFKRSTATLKDTWGTALVGNFSLGFFSFLIMLPVFLIAFGLCWLAFTSSSVVATVGAIAAAMILMVIATAITSAADAVFRTYLFAYATGRTIPNNINTSGFGNAFRQRG